jgi:hypothetical protein
MSYNGWKPYVPVAQRRARATKELARMKKKGLTVQPVEVAGRKIAASFWGKGWCDQMESFSDYENRLPRGRTYVRNGSVCHLAIQPGRIEAIVSGSELYNIVITIAPLANKKWEAVKVACAGRIGSLIDLLRGKLADGVMAVVCQRETGLFPLPGEMKLHCDCPDWASMCKHVAAVLYGAGPGRSPFSGAVDRRGDSCLARRPGRDPGRFCRAPGGNRGLHFAMGEAGGADPGSA